MSDTTLHQESNSSQVHDLVVTANADPTGAVPTFQVTAPDGTEPSSWVDGTWQTAYNATTTRITARTPTIGTTGSDIVVTGGTWALWVRYGTVVLRATLVVT